MLLVVPFGIVLLTGAMTVLSTYETLEARPVCLFFSDVLNNPVGEPWPIWALRWFIWFAGLSSYINFKRMYLPNQVQWVFVVQWATFVIAMLTGFRQVDPPMVIYSMMFKVHQTMALILFVELWLETVMLWWPNRLLHAMYLVVVPVNVVAFALSGRFYIWTGIPYVYGHPEIVLEWSLIFTHFLVVWLRFPVVSAAVEDGSWRPWTCCFGGYCPELVLHQEQTRFGCPPEQADYHRVPMEQSTLAPPSYLIRAPGGRG
jgi:hypothetical protein